jgi:ACR3 family arsenite efflux pump ArsB
MVFVWSNLTDGEPNVTLSQVALNDAIMFVAFAPVVGLLLGLSAISVPWDTLLLSVDLYIVVPVIIAQIWRRAVMAKGGEAALGRTLKALGPISLCSATIWVGTRIASPEMLPSGEPLPHLKCSPAAVTVGGKNEADQHGDA